MCKTERAKYCHVRHVATKTHREQVSGKWVRVSRWRRSQSRRAWSGAQSAGKPATVRWHGVLGWRDPQRRILQRDSSRQVSGALEAVAETPCSSETRIRSTGASKPGLAKLRSSGLTRKENRAESKDGGDDSPGALGWPPHERCVGRHLLTLH